METINPDTLLETAFHAARHAGECILDGLGGISEKDIEHKRAYDFVTRVDKDAEEAIIRTIKKQFPGHLILSEESVRDEATGHYRWIIDPLDGTTNFIHGYPVFAVSIGLEFRGRLVLGVVYDPLRKELFHALRGKGAYLNHKPIRCSSVKTLELALITTGFPFRAKEMIDVYLEAFKRVFMRVSGIRRAGAAALDFAYLAAGRCEGFFELGLKPWDIAAGALLIKEAGGIIADFGGGDDFLRTGNVVAGTPAIHDELLKEVQAVFDGIIEK